jgi:transposase
MTIVENKIYIGIDVSKATLDIWLLPNNHFIQINNTIAAIKKFMIRLKKYPNDSVHIAMESTGGYEKLAARSLAESGFKVSIVNPRFIRDFAKSHGTLAKTDKLDAKVIASFCEKMQPKENVIIDKKHDKIADLIARRDQLVLMIIAEKNRLEKAPEKLGDQLNIF